jgi:RNA polymerase sigma factor (sigma-70 family)
MAEKRHDWFLNQIFHHRAALHRYLGKLTSGAEDIEDLVQETYVRIYALPDYLQVESPKALLFRIAHNLAVERARRQKTQATDTMADFESLNVYSSEAPQDEQTDARRRFESFCAAVERLPPVCTPRFRRCSASLRALSRSTWPRAWCAVGIICGSWACWMLWRQKLARGHCAASQTAGAVNERRR